jgi:hypothetical protein
MVWFQALQTVSPLLGLATMAVAVLTAVFLIRAVRRALSREAGSPGARTAPLISVRICTIVAVAWLSLGTIVKSWTFKPGLDVTGGVRLVYLLDAQPVNAKAMTDAVRHRVGYDVTDCSVRMLDDRTIEIVVAAKDDVDLQDIQARLAPLGTLEFRILAHRRFNALDYKLAKDLPGNKRDVLIDPEDHQSEVCARWVPIDPDIVTSFYAQQKESDGANAGTGPYGTSAGLYTRVIRGSEIVDPPPRPDEMLDVDATDHFRRYKDGYTVEILAIIDRHNVTGVYLNGVGPSVDERGNPAVSFAFDSEGTNRFRQLTAEHLPTDDGFKYHLAIILNGYMTSAPTLNSVISGYGQISGYRNDERGRRERDRVVAVLKAGQLPANLTELLSVSRVAPTVDLSALTYLALAFLAVAAGVITVLCIAFRADGIAAGLALLLHFLFVVAGVCFFSFAISEPLVQSFVVTGGVLLAVAFVSCLAMHRLRRRRDPLSAARRAWGYLALAAILIGVAGFGSAWWLLSPHDDNSQRWAIGIRMATTSALFMLLLALPTMLECAACFAHLPKTLTSEGST